MGKITGSFYMGHVAYVDQRFGMSTGISKITEIQCGDPSDNRT